MGVKIVTAPTRRRLKKRQDSLRSGRAAWARTGAEIFRVIQDNFQSSGRAHVPASIWAPLAESTAREKARKRLSPLPLIRSGAAGLRGRWLVLPRSNGVEVKSPTPYAPVHQFGTRRAGRSRNVKIPARPFLLSKSHAAKIARKHIRGHVRTSLEVS